MRRMEVPASTKERALAFIHAYRDAPNDADIAIRAGNFEGTHPAILISIEGGGEHALLVSEARKVADIFEEAMNAYPNDPESAGLPNAIMCIRHGCDEAERSHAV